MSTVLALCDFPTLDGKMLSKTETCARWWMSFGPVAVRYRSLLGIGGAARRRNADADGISKAHPNGDRPRRDQTGTPREKMPGESGRRNNPVVCAEHLPHDASRSADFGAAP